MFIKKIFPLLWVIIILSFIATCAYQVNLPVYEQETVVKAENYGNLQLSYSANMSSRSEEVAIYEIIAQKDGEEDIVFTTTNSYINMSLKLGLWHLQVTGKNSNGNNLVIGYCEIDVKEGANNANIGLLPNIGALKLMISYQFSGFVSSIKATATKTGFTTISKTTTVSIDSTSLEIYMLNLHDGDWNIEIEGFDDSGNIYYSNQISTSISPFKYSNSSIILQQKKATPINFSLKSGTYGFDRNISLTSSTPDVEIRYTIGNSIPQDPTPTIGTIYSSPITISGDGSHWYIKAIAYSSTLTTSITSQEDYQIIYGTDIDLYFTSPPTDPQLDDKLVSLINNQVTSETLDVCFYGFNRDVVITALENAIARGVHIRFIGNIDGSTNLSAKAGSYYEGYYRIADALDKKFPISGKKRVNFPDDNGFEDFRLVNSSAIMHNKFVLLKDSSGSRYLYTGSTNCTDTGFERNNNNSLIIRDDAIVAVYRQQFEYLLGLSGSNQINTVNHLVIDNIPVDVLFAPNILDGQRVMDHLMNVVSLADSSLHFMIFSFPHVGLNNLILSKFDSGLDVKGIFDESQLNNSQEEFLAQRGVPCKIDGNNYVENNHGGKLHHKVMIIDSGQNDAVVVTGSFNWSDNANLNNNENLLFIHSKEIAQQYENEWNNRWAEGTPVVTVPPGDEANYQDVIINEVMWMGSRQSYSEAKTKDEFIELKNMTDSTINLTGWAIQGAGMSAKPIIMPENSFILANSYLVVLSNSKSYSAFQPTKYVINGDLSIPNKNLNLILTDPDGTVIDYAGNGSSGDNFGGFNGSGDGGLKKSLARKDVYSDGRNKENWFTTNSQVNISSDYEYLNYVCATPDAYNNSSPITYNPLNIVFSEIDWAGTTVSSTDEWIELYNNTSSAINLIGWTIQGDVTIDLAGTIPAGGHFLLERTDENSVPSADSDQIYTGSLNNAGGKLSLLYNYMAIDSINMESGWDSGASDPKISMERIRLDQVSDSSNWQYGIGDYQGAQNSIGEGISSDGISYNSLDVIVSEIDWAGTDVSSSDEWIELYNDTSNDINLIGWSLQIGSDIILLSGTIPADKHFLLERSDDNTIADLSADLIYISSLSNAGENMALLYQQTAIDTIDMSSGWPAGSNSPKYSMERININTSGSDVFNWKNGLGDTEGAQNSK